jgi:hypothetical protein
MRYIFAKENEPPHPLSRARNYHINWRGGGEGKNTHHCNYRKID